MRVILLAVVVGCFSAQAYAQTITIDLGGTPEVITVNPAQLALLQTELQRVNDTTRRDETPLTLNQWIRGVFTQSVAGFFQAARRLHADSACAKFATLSGAEQTAILDKLDGKSPCAP